MTTDDDGLDLLATLPAAELAWMQRRVAFLEAALVQTLRGQAEIKEWFNAAELAELRLPGLPTTRSGVARLARARGWETRITTGNGGETKLYHFSDLPRQAFQGFIDRVVKLRRVDDALPDAPPAAPVPTLPPRAAPAPAAATNLAPQWLLPLMRILRSGGAALEDAVQALPARMRRGAECPSLDEARTVLATLGISA